MPPTLRYSKTSGLFGLFSAYEIRKDASKAGFQWDKRGFLYSPTPYKALLFADYADESAGAMLEPYQRAIKASTATDIAGFDPLRPEGLEYLPFQKAGIWYASKQKNTLIGDEPGLGKTIQAIGLANYSKLRRILVVCPAGLRINWARELEKWHVFSPGVEPILSGKTRPSRKASLIISYDLAHLIDADQSFDLAIIDECHYVKNIGAERTRKILGTRGKPGLIDLAPRKLALSGTPIPNRVNEAYTIARKFSPDAIDRMSYNAFTNYYGYTINMKVVGIQHEEELYARLRSNIMVRRLKKDVLKDLPEKTYKMIVFPTNNQTTKILQREKPFSAQEIIKHGVPVGTALPEIRREMGVAKAPQVVTYIEDLLDDGVQKVIVYAHHQDVVSILQRGLDKYQPVVITGSTPPELRQSYVDSFQNDPSVRVFIGNLVAAGTGLTLTAAHDVVFAEASWVPGENEQAEDRAHRVGQQRGVLIHYLVVEGSLDAVILGTAARKRTNIKSILDGGEK